LRKGIERARNLGKNISRKRTTRERERALRGS